MDGSGVCRHRGDVAIDEETRRNSEEERKWEKGRNRRKEMKKKKRETGKGREEKVNERRRNRNVK
ncbi:hypothetical protein RchiOBHm_Chr6g0264811 [Rosa chinensis]|uniref:Uncharacterized protein n=1 Tax=Rosa chinensis TaxID=74649 RepID=A0A2P6PPA5_ROSCH|nr:hypothetical protein RchiOBHm_Chr6g0264811 [Rosa chinensis]